MRLPILIERCSIKTNTSLKMPRAQPLERAFIVIARGIFTVRSDLNDG